MDAYEILLREWRKADIKNADELAGRLDSFRVLFAYHSGKSRMSRLPTTIPEKFLENGKIINYTGDVRTLFEIQNQKEGPCLYPGGL